VGIKCKGIEIRREYQIMAKGKSLTTSKVSFGKRKSGKAAKTTNKHDRKEKNYRGQGR